MTHVVATVAQAAERVAADAVTAGEWNPVYRALDAATGHGPPAGQSPPAGEPGDLALLRRQLTAPGLLVVAVASPRGTRRVRIALDPAGPTLEASNGQAPSHWSWTSVPELPAVIGELLGAAGIEPAPAHLTRSSEGLRLDPRQNRAVLAALAQGAGPEEAYTAAEDLDERLRDALTATGPRLSLSVVLHDPTGAITERPVSFSRLWVSGELGMYRMDDPHRDGDAILPVTHGDVLGTALPLLEEGLRFTAACAASGGAR